MTADLGVVTGKPCSNLQLGNDNYPHSPVGKTTHSVLPVDDQGTIPRHGPLSWWMAPNYTYGPRCVRIRPCRWISASSVEKTQYFPEASCSFHPAHRSISAYTYLRHSEDVVHCSSFGVWYGFHFLFLGSMVKRAHGRCVPLCCQVLSQASKWSTPTRPVLIMNGRAIS